MNTLLLKISLCFVLAISVILLSGCGENQNTSQTTNLPSVTPEASNPVVPLSDILDDYLDTHFLPNEPGIVVMVVQEDKMSYQGNRGIANFEKGLPVNSDTPFRLASLSKSFTAIAIMQLVEQGQLRLDDSILNYIPELDSSWQQISISQLLSHQSGIPNFFTNEFILTVGFEWVVNLNNSRILDYFVSYPQLDFKPNTQADYSNSNYIFLAEVVSRTSGYMFPDYMDKFIFEPIGMNSTYIIDETRDYLPEEALNFGITHSLFDTQLYFNGAAGQVSSANDLNKFVAALLTETLISEQTLALMTQTQSVFNKDGTEYGYGWNIGRGKDNARPYFFHIGSIDGFRSLLAIEPTTGISVIILTNGGDDAEVHAANIFDEITKYFEY
ncbi:MAG: beta-lactamase family protein [Colwellia sp.]|nr:beta-lactamase family protein [Colwellia sp.]